MKAGRFYRDFNRHISFLTQADQVVKGMGCRRVVEGTNRFDVVNTGILAEVVPVNATPLARLVVASECLLPRSRPAAAVRFGRLTR